MGGLPEEQSSDEELTEDEYDSGDDDMAAGPVDPQSTQLIDWFKLLVFFCTLWFSCSSCVCNVVVKKTIYMGRDEK